jgi:hypothetical protein
LLSHTQIHLLMPTEQRPAIHSLMSNKLEAKNRLGTKSFALNLFYKFDLNSLESHFASFFSTILELHLLKHSIFYLAEFQNSCPYFFVLRSFRMPILCGLHCRRASVCLSQDWFAESETKQQRPPASFIRHLQIRDGILGRLVFHITHGVRQ